MHRERDWPGPCGRGPDPPDPLQPVLERGEIHTGARARGARRQLRRRRARHPRVRLRHRDPRVRGVPGVRRLRARQSRPLRGRRHGARPRAHEASGRAARRDHHLRERRRARHDLHRRAPGCPLSPPRQRDGARRRGRAEIGIPASEASRVFGVFERVNRDRSEAAGTGLGLALTKRLVELHGGTITFESVVGRGTTFTVVLPDARYRLLDSETVLVVEDEPADAELIGAIVTQAGFATHRVSTLTEAYEAVRNVRPLAVILDLYLPDGHGAAILETLRASEETKDVPVLVLTSATETVRFQLMGAECMTKPIDSARVRGWLRQVAPSVATEVAA